MFLGAAPVMFYMPNGKHSVIVEKVLKRQYFNDSYLLVVFSVKFLPRSARH